MNIIITISFKQDKQDMKGTEKQSKVKLTKISNNETFESSLSLSPKSLQRSMPTHNKSLVVSRKYTQSKIKTLAAKKGRLKRRDTTSITS